MNQLPEIRIKNAWLLRQNASNHLHELWGEGTPLTSDERIDQKVKDYQGAWKPLEKKILEGMTGLLGLSFRQNIVDVYIAPWFSAFSDPMVIGVRLESDQFVDVLAHELVHRLLTDNTSLNGDEDLVAKWKKLFGTDKEFNTLIHIPVHAVSKAIYLDILNDKGRLQRDIKASANSADYKEAWNYVEDNDYKEIINQLKESYRP